MDEAKKSRCPGCDRIVDPLRSASVSIVDGQMVHFCSAECRERIWQKGSGSVSEMRDGNTAAGIDDDRDEAAANVETKEEVASTVSEGLRTSAIGATDAGNGTQTSFFSGVNALSMGGGRIREYLIEIGLLVPTLAASWLWRGNTWMGWVALVLVGLAGLVEGIAWRHRGIGRMLSELAFFVAAGLLVATGMYAETAPDSAVAWGIGVVLIRNVGRILEWAIGVRMTRSKDALSSWRDNSALSLRLGRIALYVERGRLLLGALAGGGFYLAGLPVYRVGVGVALVLIVLDPQLLRNITANAFYRVALLAEQIGVVARDSDAISRLGRSRLVLFLARYNLFSGPLKVVDWRMVSSEPEGQMMSALYAVEAPFDDRFSQAIMAFLKSKNVTPLESGQAVRIEGKGVCGDTLFGEVVCGTREVMLERGIGTGAQESWAAQIAASGRRPFFLAVSKDIKAVFAVEESVDPAGASLVRRLVRWGFEPVVFTSAESVNAIALAGRLGIEYVKASRRESDVEATLLDCQQAGDAVAMVGAGEAFESNIRNADGAVFTGIAGSKHSMAGIFAASAGLEAVVDVLVFARCATRGVTMNLFIVGMFVACGGCLSAGWVTWGMGGFLSGMASAVTLFCMINVPHPRIRAWVERCCKRVVSRAADIVKRLR